MKRSASFGAAFILVCLFFAFSLLIPTDTHQTRSSISTDGWSSRSKTATAIPIHSTSTRSHWMPCSSPLDRTAISPSAASTTETGTAGNRETSGRSVSCPTRSEPGWSPGPGRTERRAAGSTSTWFPHRTPAICASTPTILSTSCMTEANTSIGTAIRNGRFCPTSTRSRTASRRSPTWMSTW